MLLENRPNMDKYLRQLFGWYLARPRGHLGLSCAFYQDRNWVPEGRRTNHPGVGPSSLGEKQLGNYCQTDRNPS